MNDAHDFLVVAVHGVLGVKFEIGQGFLRLVIEALLHGEGHGDFLALIQPVVAHEPVHPGAEYKGLAYGTADDMEEGEFVLRAACVLLFQICFQRTVVQVEADKCLVIGTVRHDAGHDSIHGGDIFEPNRIPAISHFSLGHILILQ